MSKLSTIKEENENIKYEVVDEDKSQDIDTMKIKPSIQEAKGDTMTMEQKISEFKLKHNPVVYILTPCFASLCYVNYVHSLMRTTDLFRKLGIPLKVEFCKNDSLVSRERNNLIARAMTDKTATHFLFIDNDITWEPADILKLLLSEKELIGGIYPLKNYDWNKLLHDPQNPYNSNVVQSMIQKKNSSQLRTMLSDGVMIQSNLLKYNINYIDSVLQIDRNMARVKHLATGFMMIRRPVLEKMMKAFPSTKYVDDVNFLRPEENEYAYALFDLPKAFNDMGIDLFERMRFGGLDFKEVQ